MEFPSSQMWVCLHWEISKNKSKSQDLCPAVRVHILKQVNIGACNWVLIKIKVSIFISKFDSLHCILGEVYINFKRNCALRSVIGNTENDEDCIPVVYNCKSDMQKYWGKEFTRSELLVESKKMSHFISPDCVSKNKLMYRYGIWLQYIFKSWVTH